jgi:ubiquinone/menaquinone biosynthesis C-methylase UbiE
LAALARQRVRDLSLANVSVRDGEAQNLPLAERSVDLVHARWAYFLGPGCEPGLAEVERVLRPGGTAFVIDNDATRSTFGRWFRMALPAYDPSAVERFWVRQGWSRERIDMRWSFPSRADFESVLRIEFTQTLADGILADHQGAGVDYAVNLWWHTFG